MGPRYEVAPVARAHRWRLALVAVVLLLGVAVALAKPWSGPSAVSLVATPKPAPTVPTSQAAQSVAGGSGWPALASLRPDSTNPTSTATAIRFLGARAGTWGVGDGGSGPRLIRDEVWTDWTALTPGASTALPNVLSTGMSVGTCAGLPLLADRPSVVAVTASAAIGSGWRLTAWWSNGHEVLSISGSVRQVSLPGVGGVEYLERLDEAPWPDGRYELHVTTGHRTYALSVCIELPA
jgi:hypothetical protein